MLVLLVLLAYACIASVACVVSFLLDLYKRKWQPCNNGVEFLACNGGLARRRLFLLQREKLSAFWAIPGLAKTLASPFWPLAFLSFYSFFSPFSQLIFLRSELRLTSTERLWQAAKPARVSARPGMDGPASGGPSLASQTLGGPTARPPLDSSPLWVECECLLSTASAVQLDSWTEKVDSSGKRKQMGVHSPCTACH